MKSTKTTRHKGVTRKTEVWKGRGQFKRTSMWLNEELLAASLKKAEELGVSRTLYFQQLLKKDLGLDTELPAEPQSVFE